MIFSTCKLEPKTVQRKHVMVDKRTKQELLFQFEDMSMDAKKRGVGISFKSSFLKDRNHSLGGATHMREVSPFNRNKVVSDTENIIPSAKLPPIKLMKEANQF